MSVSIRGLSVDDYTAVIENIDAWWGGRHMADMLPRLFFVHFTSTSLAAITEEGELVGFLVGFHSPTRRGEAYIHFVGVDPTMRSHGVGRSLYSEFIAGAKAAGCDVVRAVTSPVNQGSIEFHLSLGFEMEEGPIERDGVWIQPDYDGPGKDRVRFRLKI